jgi:D-alanyl-D-alanine carboxypeptidase
MFEKPKDTLQLIVHESDIPFVDRGSLIPGAFTPRSFVSPTKSTRRVIITWPQVGRVFVVSLTAIMLLVMGTAGYGFVAGQGQVASPIVTVIDPLTQTETTLDYGPLTALSKNNFYTQTRDAFIADEVTFIELDLTRNQLRYFEAGVLVQSAEILTVGSAGSWWDTPSGMYQVGDLEKTFFSNLAQANFPWAISFEENFLIHGQPTYPDGAAVPDGFVAGGIRIADDAAKALFAAVEPGTTVLVHTVIAPQDTFIYEPPAPEISAPHYFVADVETGAVLASSAIDEKASIASVTKLMTAVVAAEELPLDRRVVAASANFVTSMIPRLESRASVSMYSLLQLLLVESSNEAAEVIASELGREEFIAAMNTKARQLGMLNTTFTDPSGLDSGNISTVGDLYQLTRYIHRNRQFIIDITRDVTLPSAYEGGDFSGLVNFNEIEDVTGFVGGKVGETLAAGQTSVSLHELKIDNTTRTVVVIVLGSTGRTADVQTLVSFVESQFGD